MRQGAASYSASNPSVRMARSTLDEFTSPSSFAAAVMFQSQRFSDARSALRWASCCASRPISASVGAVRGGALATFAGAFRRVEGLPLAVGFALVFVVFLGVAIVVASIHSLRGARTYARDRARASTRRTIRAGCTSTTASNCCGVACPAVANGAPACAGGACVASCTAGFANCDGDTANGCECHPAHATGACMARSCAVAACEAGYGDCDGNPANGCEVDLRASSDHCGACRAPCAAGRACMAGACDACDADHDGFLARACGGMDCDDNDPASHPGAPEVCDGFDNDCNGRDDDAELITGTFTPDCSRLVDTAYPATMNTSPAVCERVPTVGRPAGTERYVLVCRRRIISAGITRCVCVAANGAHWDCGCS